MLAARIYPDTKMRFFTKFFHLAFASIALLWACGMPLAHAEDAPYLRLDTALVEGDDENQFEFATRYSGSNGDSISKASLGYSFNPLLSVEVQLGHTEYRNGDDREAEVELSTRYVLVDHNRDDWGLALKAAYQQQSSGNASFKEEGPALNVVFTKPFGEKTGNLHLNLGASRQNSKVNTSATWGIGVDVPLAQRAMLFAEFSGRDTTDQVIHGGMRWWLKYGKIALDTSMSNTMTFGNSGSATERYHIGLVFFDLR